MRTSIGRAGATTTTPGRHRRPARSTTSTGSGMTGRVSTPWRATSYNSRGQVTQFTSPTGGVTDYTYDAQTNLWKVTGPSNNDSGTRPITTYLYDTLGRVTSVSNALNKATTYTYDALDRVATGDLAQTDRRVAAHVHDDVRLRQLRCSLGPGLYARYRPERRDDEAGLRPVRAARPLGRWPH